MITPNRNMLLLPALVASLGFAGSAAAQEFTIGANVSNAIAITETTPMTFGNLFATATKVGGAAAADSAKVTMNPQGVVTVPAVAAGTPPVAYLSGAAAGAYRIPGLPIGSNVVVEIQNPNGDVAVWTTALLAECVYDDANEALASGEIVLTAGGPGQGAFSAFFCVNAFSARSGTTDVTTTLIGTGAAAGTGLLVGGPTGGIIDFTLGATLVAQAGTLVATYENTAYSGVFNMEVQFK